MIAILAICALLAFTLLIFYTAYAMGFKRNAYTPKTKSDPSSKMRISFSDTIKAGIDFANSAPCERVYIKSDDGLRLCARFYKGNLKKLIILFHGYRSTAEHDFGNALEWYLSRGLNVLLVDQRAHSNSEGKYITFGLKERYDCKKWCEYAAEEHPEMDIYLAGISMGAATVLMATELGLVKNVKAIVADCGYSSPEDIIEQVLKRDVHIPFAKPMMRISNAIFCKPFGHFDIYAASAVGAMKKNSTIPVLFIHGKADSFVPCEMTVENFNACAAKKQLLMVDNANHALSYLVDMPGVQHAISSFIGL